MSDTDQNRRARLDALLSDLLKYQAKYDAAEEHRSESEATWMDAEGALAEATEARDAALDKLLNYYANEE